jgi:transcriptional regulator with XRE-family HTH domain
MIAKFYRAADGSEPVAIFIDGLPVEAPSTRQRCRLERGAHAPSVDTLQRIADAFGKDLIIDFADVDHDQRHGLPSISSHLARERSPFQWPRGLIDRQDNVDRKASAQFVNVR